MFIVDTYLSHKWYCHKKPTILSHHHPKSSKLSKKEIIHPKLLKLSILCQKSPPFVQVFSMFMMSL